MASIHPDRNHALLRIIQRAGLAQAADTHEEPAQGPSRFKRDKPGETYGSQFEAGYGSRKGIYELLFMLIVTIPDQEVVAKLAELDMIASELEAATSRIATVERRNVRPLSN